MRIQQAQQIIEDLNEKNQKQLNKGKRPSNKVKALTKKQAAENLQVVKTERMKLKSAKNKQISFKLYQED